MYSYDRKVAALELPLEGDNVDKTSDIITAIKNHLGGCIAAVDDCDMIAAGNEAEAVRDLAQALMYMIRVMDPNNG